MIARRRRALAFGLLAALAATVAAVLANGYGSRVARGYGPLRPVVVASAQLPAGRAIDPQALAARLEVRRVPARFVPPGVLTRPLEAAGLEPVAPIPAGAYVQASQLRSPRRPRQPGTGLPEGRRPVEIAVAGAGALLATGDPAGATVDVVVTREPAGPGPGRTYIAAPAVPLLALNAAPGGAGPGSTAAATLALTRPEALELIAAESFARQVRLLPVPLRSRPGPPRRQAGPGPR